MTRPGLPCVLLRPAACAVALGHLVYERVSKRFRSVLPVLVASLGANIVIQNLLSLSFGDNRRVVRTWAVEAGIALGGARVTVVQITAFLSAATAVGIFWLLGRTAVGAQLRALANDSILATIQGIPAAALRLLATGLAGACAGAAGVLLACDLDVTPGMGLRPLMVAVVAVLLGGQTVLGTAAGAFFLGLSQNIAVQWFGAEWQDVITFSCMLIVLFLRPRRLVARVGEQG